jgi:hypothetical protein
VQQLCEAGEAEFLEIMDLVGMASKPMHVRRLQKALQEWVQNPGKSFNTSFFILLHFSSCYFSIARRDSTLIGIIQFFDFESK